MDYKPATEEMMEMVRAVVRKSHARLKGLHLAVVMQEKASMSKGHVRLAFVQKPTAVMRPLLEHKNTAFVICIAKNTWDQADEARRRAIVDHELCHCGVSDDAPYLRPHDYEEFAEIVGRHGFWRQDLAEKAMRQAALELPLGEDGDGDGAKVGTIRDRRQKTGANVEQSTSNVEHPTGDGVAELGSCTVEFGGKSAVLGSPESEGLVREFVRRGVDVNEHEEEAEMVEKAMEVLRDTRRASTSSLQRRLGIGYTRAARLMDLLELRGVVGPTRGAEPREILVDLDAAPAAVGG